MSAAPINRSLATVRTELEFLYDSEVINKDLFDALMESLPQKYSKDMEPWGRDKIPGSAAKTTDSKTDSKTDSLADSMAKTSLVDVAPPANPPVAPVPERRSAPALGYCRATYNYSSSEDGDLSLTAGDRLAVLEHLSPDWWKGHKRGEPASSAGVFPSNYVTVISEVEFNAAGDNSSEKASYQPEKASYQPDNFSHEPEKSSYSPSPSYSNSGYASPPYYQQQPQQQPSYGGYAQFPPAPTNYYQQQPQQGQVQQVQQAEQQQPQHSPGSAHLKKFGSKLGNAAIFGAGATIGSDIVNKIF